MCFFFSKNINKNIIGSVAKNNPKQPLNDVDIKIFPINNTKEDQNNVRDKNL